MPPGDDESRVVVDLTAKCRLINGPARYDVVRITGMNHQGCMIEAPSAIAPGSALRIVFEIPYEGQVSMNGTAASSRPIDEDNYAVDVHFVIDGTADEEMSLKIYQYCLLRKPQGT